MTESSIYKSYLYISENQFTLSIFNSENSEKVLEKIFVLEDALNHNKLDELNLFLANNLYDIEKKIGSFIKEIFIIYDSKKFFSINISIKNNNYGEQINNSSLYRLCNCCKNLKSKQ